VFIGLVEDSSLFIAKDDFYKGTRKLYDRANLCVQLQGIDVENETMKVSFLSRRYFL